MKHFPVIFCLFIALTCRAQFGSGTGSFGSVGNTGGSGTTINISGNTNVVQVKQTTFVAGVIYTNTTSAPYWVRASVGAVVGAGSAWTVYLTYDPLGGTPVNTLSCAGMTNGSSISITGPFELSGVVTNGGTYCFTNGAVATEQVVPGTGQIITLAAGSMVTVNYQNTNSLAANSINQFPLSISNNAGNTFVFSTGGGGSTTMSIGNVNTDADHGDIFVAYALHTDTVGFGFGSLSNSFIMQTFGLDPWFLSVDNGQGVPGNNNILQLGDAVLGDQEGLWMVRTNMQLLSYAETYNASGVMMRWDGPAAMIYDGLGQDIYHHGSNWMSLDDHSYWNTNGTKAYDGTTKVFTGSGSGLSGVVTTNGATTLGFVPTATGTSGTYTWQAPSASGSGLPTPWVAGTNAVSGTSSDMAMYISNTVTHVVSLTLYTNGTAGLNGPVIGNGSGITNILSPTITIVTNEDFTILTKNQYYTNNATRRLFITLDEVLTADATHAASLGLFYSTNGTIVWTNFRTNSSPVVVVGSVKANMTDFLPPGTIYVITNLDASGITAPSTIAFTHRSYQ